MRVLDLCRRQNRPLLRFLVVRITRPKLQDGVDPLRMSHRGLVDSIHNVEWKYNSLTQPARGQNTTISNSTPVTVAERLGQACMPSEIEINGLRSGSATWCSHDVAQNVHCSQDANQSRPKVTVKLRLKKKTTSHVDTGKQPLCSLVSGCLQS